MVECEQLCSDILEVLGASRVVRDCIAVKDDPTNEWGKTFKGISTLSVESLDNSNHLHILKEHAVKKA